MQSVKSLFLNHLYYHCLLPLVFELLRNQRQGRVVDSQALMELLSPKSISGWGRTCRCWEAELYSDGLSS